MSARICGSSAKNFATRIFDLRLLAVLFVLFAGVMLATNIAPVRTRLVIGQVGDVGVRYPTQDCGRNIFSATLVERNGEDDCHIKNAWSSACVSYWIALYRARDATLDMLTEAEAVANGYEYGGSANYFDEVLRDLERGVIRCP